MSTTNEITKLGRANPHDTAQPENCASGLLHELFERRVDLCGDAIAIIGGGAQLTYTELEERSNRLAHYLRDLNVGPGTFVGIHIHRSELPIVAILACLKAGAAYVPIEPTQPDDRARYIIREAETAVLLTERTLASRARSLFTGRIVALDDRALEIATRPRRRLPRVETKTCPHDLCYVVYTSGTTGRPKGITTEHRNAYSFVLAFNEACETTRYDRVYQGFPLGFDGSVEEIWMAFSNGGTLVVGGHDTPRFGDDLARYLAHHQVSYFSTTPTVLSTMTEDVPSLRQLVVSGEPCPPELVARWARAGLRFLNVYGPTETTVNATAAVCEPGRPITVGRPLRGYSAMILDARMRPVSQGTVGELHVGGSGVARGYLGQPALSAERFVSCPGGGRLYRTGDLARINSTGEIELVGRIDDQVKIRGYRIELSEIEAVLLEDPQVASATTEIHHRDGLSFLAAYVVLDKNSAPLDRGRLLATLRARLPDYMIPAYLDVLDSLPMLATGKVDRRRLPAPTHPLMSEAVASVPPQTPLEAVIADAWASLFRIERVGIDHDFFLDLGGHSLLAAQAVAKLRDRTALHVAVRDIYAFPSVRKLAQHLEVQRSAELAGLDKRATTALTPLKPVPGRSAGVLQACFILASLALFSTPLLGVVPFVDDLLRERIPVLGLLAIVASLSLAWWPVMIALSVVAKWLVIGRYRAGAYPLWGSYYLRWWLVSVVQRLSGAGLFTGTPLMPVYYRLMGAKVGDHCALETGKCSAFDLVSIGNHTSIGADTQLLGYRVENGYLILGRVDIGSECFVGVHSTLALNVKMGDGARLDDQSLLPDGESIPPGEHRRGSPARPAQVEVPAGEPRRGSKLRLVMFAALALLLSSLVGLAMAAPALTIALLLSHAFVDSLRSFLAGTFALVATLPLLVAFYCLWIALLKAVLLHRAMPGIYPLYSAYYLRHWLASGLMRVSRAILLPVFSTLYLPHWMRLLGAKVGAHAEMSTVRSFIPELLLAGEASFFADGCIIGGRRTHGGRFELRPNRVGRRSFVGNSAVLPAGASLGDGSLLGVLSMPPSRSQATPDGSDWLGSPAFQLPNRQKIRDFDDSVTFRPTPRLYAQRALFDACRIMIPAYTVAGLGLGGAATLLFAYETYGLWVMLALGPLLELAAAAIAVAVVVGLKWIVMGRFRPVISPLWCSYIWRNEMLTGAYETIMAPVVAMVFGTPFAGPLLRLLGCKIGRHCYIGTALFAEFDLVDIGDHVALNAGAVIQNHLFEDRIMKSSYLQIDDECSIGNMAVILYDTRMEQGAVLGPLSLLMKGESQPAGSRWHGIPTVGG
jgi:non-ribosomal peptide synthetase-like protein